MIQINQLTKVFLTEEIETLILADEPTGNLDSKNGLEVMELLTELNREGTTIVMVTHSLHDADFAHRTVNLFDGKVLTEEKKMEVEKRMI
jgi:putative ABC transport system ATP-binding protein